MHAWLLLGAISVAVAQVPDAPTPTEALDEAREAYLLGQHDAARAGFVAITERARVDGDVPFEIEAEAWAFLGEMQYLQGDRAGADASFRLVLTRDLAYRLSPYDHPMDVIGAFELVRDELAATRTAGSRRAMPWWGYAPFGVPQFQQGQRARGAAYATFQGIFAAGSVAAWVVLDRQAQRLLDDQIPQETREAELERARTLRTAMSYTTATAFYLTWGISVADAGTSWRRTNRGQPALIGVGFQPGGAELVVGWQF